MNQSDRPDGNSELGTNVSSVRWSDRVGEYLDRLSAITEEIDLILDETRVGTVNVDPAEVDRSRTELTAALTKLEAMIPHREDLLKADDAPPVGISLVEKLQSSMHVDDARVARRCDAVSQQIDDTRHRALALFVCQYHLASLGQDLIHLLAGAADHQTYGKSMRSKTKRGLGQDRLGGGLFNEAA